MSEQPFELRPEDLELTPWGEVPIPTEDISDEEVYGDEPPPRN